MGVARRTTEAPGGVGTPPGAHVRASLRRSELVILAAMVGFPLVVRDSFMVDRFGQYFLLAIFAISVDLIWGYGGMFTFGHAVFFGGGGYIVAILSTHTAGLLPLPIWVVSIFAVAVTGLAALGIAYFVFYGRAALGGVEFAVVTLAVAVLAERVANAGGQVTGGQNGILMTARLAIPGVGSFHRGYGFYVFAGLLLVGTYLGVQRFLRSRQGLIVRGIRENEERVGMLGYEVPRVKLRTFVLSGAIAGLAGALFHIHSGVVSPGSVGVGQSTLVLLWVVLGGRGTLIGPVIGAVLLAHLTASLSGELLDTWLVAIGVILVAVILALPAGIFGFLRKEPPT